MTHRASRSSFSWISRTISCTSAPLVARDIRTRGGATAGSARFSTSARRRACRSRSSARDCARSFRRRARASRLRCARRHSPRPHSRCVARRGAKLRRHSRQRFFVDIPPCRTALPARAWRVTSGSPDGIGCAGPLPTTIPEPVTTRRAASPAPVLTTATSLLARDIPRRSIAAPSASLPAVALVPSGTPTLASRCFTDRW